MTTRADTYDDEMGRIHKALEYNNGSDQYQIEVQQRFLLFIADSRTYRENDISSKREGAGMPKSYGWPRYVPTHQRQSGRLCVPDEMDVVVRATIIDSR